MKHTRLRILELDGTEAFDTGGDELIVLPLAGSCTRHDRRRGASSSRAARACSPAVSDFAYAPIGAHVEISRAAAASRCPPRRRRAGSSRATAPPRTCRSSCAARATRARQVNNFASVEAFECRRADRRRGADAERQLVVVSAARTTSHDDARGDLLLRDRAAAASPTSASTTAWTLLAEVRSGDVIEMPRGYHGPSMAAPGYDLYYLNVMAGERARVELRRRPRPRLDPRLVGRTRRSTRDCR